MKADEILQQERKAAGEMAATATGMPEYKSAADFDARFSQMLAADAERERTQKEKEIQRKQIAQGMSDLGAVFGDVIKASGGALVTPRDVQAKYDALDKQTQSVYDNYRARMDAMRKGLQDNAAKDRNRALKAKEDAANRQWQMDLYAKKKADDDARAEKDREARIKAAYARNYNYNYNRKEVPKYSLDFGDEHFDYNDADGSRIYNSIYRYMRQNGIIKDEALPEDATKKGLSQNVIDVLVMSYLPILTGEQLSDIYKMITGKTKKFENGVLSAPSEVVTKQSYTPSSDFLFVDANGNFKVPYLGVPPSANGAATAQPTQTTGRINRQEKQTNTRGAR